MKRMIPSRVGALGLRGFLALALLLVTLGVPAFAADPRERLETIEQRQERAQARADALGQRADELDEVVAAWDAKVARVQGEVDVLDGKLSKLSDRIAETREDLTQAQVRVAFLSQELQRIESRLDNRTDLFTGRAVAAYKAGPNAYLEGLVSSTSFNELTDRLAYYEAALDSDSKIVEEIDVLRIETEVRREEVEEKQQEIAAKKLRLETDKAAVAEVRQQRSSVLAARRAILREKQATLRAVESKRSQYLQVVAQLEADADSIHALLAARTASASGPMPTGGGQLLWPAAGPVTSGYGYRVHPIFGYSRMHTGIDIGAPYGAPVIASDSGVVAYVGAMSGYGNTIVVDHGGGLATTYNHLSAFGVSSGQSVQRGAPIGSVGCTGYCTGPHLHFEVRVNGSPVDPMPYLQ